MLGLDEKTRKALWTMLTERWETYLASLPDRHIPGAPPSETWPIHSFNFPKEPLTALTEVLDQLESGILHVSHPCYFGVFNPAPATMGVLAEAMVAAWNPQLASYVSGGFALDVERQLLCYFGKKFGFAEGSIDGIFTHGGTEANLTALLVALHEKFPDFARTGVRGLPQPPTLYVSSETHHSFLKAARATGLGEQCVVEIPVGSDRGLDVKLLKRAIQHDRKAGRCPLFVVGTLGTTSAGIWEDLQSIAAVADEESLWFHVDAAWGGAAVFVPELLNKIAAGTSQADSITLDAHKWLCVPMTAGMLITSNPGSLERTFRVGKTPYMPMASMASMASEGTPQPYAQSLSWSRRSLGIKLYLSLLVAGESGYEVTLRRMISLAELLRSELKKTGWTLLNETPLPVVCFTRRGLETSATTESFCQQVTQTGKAWITTTRLSPDGVYALRAGIVNYRTAQSDVHFLVALLCEVVRARETR